MDVVVKEQKLLSGSEKQFGIYQITARDPEHDYRFMNLDFVKRHGMEVNRADYELVYTEPLTEKDTLEAIYERFNIQRPTDFTGHSLSVSDVVVLNDGKSIKACYVDSIGFAELPDFFKERKMDLKKETILDEQLQEIEIFDKPGLFSNSRLRDEDVPEGLYRYDLRGSDYDPGQPILVEKTVIVNHAASVLMAEELDLGADGRLELGEEGLNFTGGLLTVREFMKEQEEKNNGLLHGDSDHITVEGHVGTWYVVDETEVGGEKFFLLEHEEYGDEAACVAVNEQGKLVAEDLWNGFDEDFQDAVKEYFAEKNPTSQKEEQAVPVAEESRTDNSDVPVYYESFAYAAENGEVDLYRISRQLNEDCRNAIEEAIADNFDGMHLADDATKSVVEQFGMERMGYILAYTLNYNNHDGRYSHSNKEWAETTCKGERGNNIRPDWIVRSHPAVLNGFVDMYRKELEAEQQREPEKPFVQQFYVVTDLQTNPMQIEKFGDLDDAMSCYQQVPNFHLKALGVEKTPDPLPGSLDIVQCKNGIDTIVEDYKKVPGWDNPYIQNHVVALVAEALKVQDVAVAYEINDGYFHIQTSEDGYDYTLYSKDFTVMDGGRPFGVGDVIVINQQGEITAYFVDKDSLVVVAGFIRSSSSGILVTLDTKNLFIDGCAGTWMATEECVVESQHFFLMQHEVYKEKAPNVIVDASGKLVSTEIRKGLDEDARKKILDYLHPPLMEKPMNQKPSLHQMEHYQKFYENGEYVRAVESTTEQNYNMIDGCANNLPKPRIINGRESVLDKLRIRQMAREKQKSSQEQSADMERNRK